MKWLHRIAFKFFSRYSYIFVDTNYCKTNPLCSCSIIKKKNRNNKINKISTRDSNSSEGPGGDFGNFFYTHGLGVQSFLATYSWGVCAVVY